MDHKNYLGINFSELETKGGKHTAREIQQQPRLWLETFEIISGQQAAIAAFLDKVYGQDHLRVILTGAGTSAFIGNILQGFFQKNTGKNTWAIATTDLVSHPQLYFEAEVPTLLVSFARSGNSPESIAAVDLADQICKQVFHLIITCNPAGQLATQVQPGGKSYAIHMPAEADDQSLAMTGSFSCMLLAGLLISRIQGLDALKVQVNRLAAYGNNIIENYPDKLRKLAALDFKRAVFLGSGPFQGTARESQLKLQELTDGKVICKFDSFLGFRHGPKVVIDDTTLIVYQLSNDTYSQLYELDLIKQINSSNKGLAQVLIAEEPISIDDFSPSLELFFAGNSEESTLDIEYLSIAHVVFAQMLRSEE